MANTLSIKRHAVFGDLLLKIVEVTGDGSATTMTAGSVGLSYILGVWTQDIDDDAIIDFSVMAGSTVTFDAITSTKKQLFFVLGW